MVLGLANLVNVPSRKKRVLLYRFVPEKWYVTILYFTNGFVFSFSMTLFYLLASRFFFYYTPIFTIFTFSEYMEDNTKTWGLYFITRSFLPATDVSRIPFFIFTNFLLYEELNISNMLFYYTILVYCILLKRLSR